MSVAQLRNPSPSDESTDQATGEPAFDWRACWYPVAFSQDLPRDRPYGFSLYDEPLVLFFDDAGAPVCLRDRCPHRAARLSDGQLVEGRIECLYHGWQFDGTGRCRHIPQLPEQMQIPPKTCVRDYRVLERQGIVWLWAGESEAADPALLPLTPGLDSPGVFRVDFQMDLPYDQSYLIENIIDVAHIHIAHDGVRGGGLRSLAKPLEFDIQDSSMEGIRSGFRTLGRSGSPGTSQLKGALVEFVAPNLIRYTSAYRNPELMAGLALYSIPFGKSRCRLLYRKYSNFLSWRERWKPRWLEHWTQCLILEQDMGVVVGQYEEIERAEQDLRQLWFPLKTSDRLVIEYRRWLDTYGANLPFYRGFASAKPAEESTQLTPPPGWQIRSAYPCLRVLLQDPAPGRGYPKGPMGRRGPVCRRRHCRRRDAPFRGLGDDGPALVGGRRRPERSGASIPIGKYPPSALAARISPLQAAAPGTGKSRGNSGLP